MRDHEFKKQLSWSMSLKYNGLHENASHLLDELADAFLYADTYKKSLDDSLAIVKSLKKRVGQETTKFLVMKIRDDREQALTCSLTEELSICLIDSRQERDESNNTQKIVAFIKNNKKLYHALAENASAQYINRLLVKTVLQAKAAKLKKFYTLNKNLFD